MTPRISQAFSCLRKLLLATLLLPAHLLPAAHAQSPAASASLDEVLAQAQTAQAAGQYAQSASAYARATTLDPSIPELWANRGLMEHLAGQPEMAIASFKHALAGKPHLVTALLFTGVDYAALNQPRQALPYLDHVLRLQPSNPDALLALGESLTTLGDLDRAAATLEKAVAVASTNPATWFSLATTRLALIDRDGAQLARHSSENTWAQALYAEELLVQGRTGEAAEAYIQAVATASPQQRSLFAAVLVSQRQSADSSLSGVAPEAIDRVLSILQPSSSPVAVPCSSTARAATSPAAPSSGNAACSYLDGEASASAASAAAALASRPADPEALFWSVKANERRSVEALSTFERLAPQSPATFDLMGDLFRRRLQPDRALAEYARALATDPHDAPALLGTAAAYLATGRANQAADTASLALADRPDNPRLNLLMGEALVAQHQFPAARPFVDRALTGARSASGATSASALLPSAYALSGQIKADAGDVNGAISDLTLGLPSDTDGSLSFQLSRLYRRQGQLALANQTEAHAKDLLASRRAHAVIAVQSSSEATP